VEKGRTIDGAVGEKVSLVVSLFCSTSLWGFKVFGHYETKYVFPLLLCVIVSRLKSEKGVKGRKQPRDQGLTKMLKIGP
jgi:hypothetical protein